MDKQTRLCPECGKEGWLEVADTRTTPTPPAGKVEAVAERKEVLIEAVDSVMNCAAAMGIKLRTNHGTTEENAWQLANAALKASSAEHIAGLVGALSDISMRAGQIASGDYKACGLMAEQIGVEILYLTKDAIEALPPELRGK